MVTPTEQPGAETTSDTDTAIALIPARAGSKGLPGKNLRPVGGVSLLARAILVAQAVEGVNRIIVSTDGPDIAEEARRYGADVHDRPLDLASDRAPVIETIRHVLKEQRERGRTPRYGLLLEPTSPLRTVQDVQRCLDAVREGADSSATFTEAAVHPHRTFVIEEGTAKPFIEGAIPWKPRQALQPEAYQLSGSAYAFRCDHFPPTGLAVLFGRIAPIVVPPERSVDIDDANDLRVVEAMLAASPAHASSGPVAEDKGML
jgi:CMP-N,N'-diacetyllegionaminic acid synthase